MRHTLDITINKKGCMCENVAYLASYL